MDHSLNCRLTIVKVEPVEVHPLHQVPQTFRLKRGQSGVTDLPEKIENYSNISHYEELPVGGCRGVDVEPGLHQIHLVKQALLVLMTSHHHRLQARLLISRSYFELHFIDF